MNPIRTRNTFILIAAIFAFSSCGSNNDTYYPKPRGFFRLDLPDKKYVTFDSVYPFTCRIPESSYIVPVKTNDPSTVWFNLVFPQYNGSVNFSYKPVNNNLYKLTEDAREFANKHIAKANEITEIRVSNTENKVYGLIYDIEGTNSASPYQFYLTDSVQHFVRGSLYFDAIPNNDSLAPVISFVKEDIQHMFETMSWK